MEDPFQDDDREAQRKAQEELNRQKWEKIIATKDGRWAMWQIIEGCGVTEVLGGERSVGMHSVGITLASRLRSVNIELYHQMIVENDR